MPLLSRAKREGEESDAEEERATPRSPLYRAASRSILA
jgi:hypothetical protein